ncbi:DUF3761 domain-containing protein [Streptomyces griseorubiginosus]|uniref:DUF3761 domain-containing protein n=1 Tax=Streptomyces griseorubiginosus TaxID=67304 RepID=UPI00363BCE0C
MAQSQRPQPTAEDKKNLRLGCGIILAALLAIGGCNALVNDDRGSSSGSSSASSVDDDHPGTVTVADFVGMGLQAAQDAAQADGIYDLDSTDATGQDRQQLWDRNWTVCAQTPAAGQTMSTEDTLTFDTVKSSEGETCQDPTGWGESEDSSISGDDPSTATSTDDTYGDDSASNEAATAGDDTNDSSSSDSSSSIGGTDSTEDDSSSSSSGDTQQAPAGATAQCNDGTYSYSAHRRGTCSHHGGVAVWLASVPS